MTTILLLVLLFLQPEPPPQLRFQLTGAFGVALFVILMGILVTWFWRWRTKTEEHGKEIERRLRNAEERLAHITSVSDQVMVTNRLASIERDMTGMRELMTEIKTKIELFWPQAGRALGTAIFDKDRKE